MAYLSERPAQVSLARVAAITCVKNMTVLAQDHIDLPDHDARLARVLRPELRAAPRPLPREGSQIRSGVGRPPRRDGRARDGHDRDVRAGLKVADDADDAHG